MTELPEANLVRELVRQARYELFRERHPVNERVHREGSAKARQGEKDYRKQRERNRRDAYLFFFLPRGETNFHWMIEGLGFDADVVLEYVQRDLLESGDRKLRRWGRDAARAQ